MKTINGELTGRVGLLFGAVAAERRPLELRRDGSRGTGTGSRGGGGGLER